MKVNFLVVGLVTIGMGMSSCVSSKKFKAEQLRVAELTDQNSKLRNDVQSCENEKTALARDREAMQQRLQNDIDALTRQVGYLKENNTTALKQLQDLSVISASQAESIKKSLENIGAKDAYIADLQTAMARKDSLNMALVMNIKGAIGNLSDEDINVKVDKGVVYIDISDKLLFKSGSYVVTPGAKQVLGKVAKVLLNQPNMEYMVEGHTDNVPFRRGELKDNWDLSVLRATAVVRVLQKEYGIPANQIAAAGRAEYRPIADNESVEGRSTNRRTRIIILPQLDQFFKLLEPKQGAVNTGTE
ncbi:MAG TPA: flagellar motor protein MotB [Chitinophagaceae bacterium]|nr:flagellar motor protein MotB [Chitinophagaceae bacterium]